MLKLLNEISVIPGVSGSCIFDKNRGVICKKLQEKLPQDLTDNVGINFIRLLQMAGMNNLAIKSAHFRFDRYWLIGTPLDQGIILLTVCDLQANCSLIASTAAMLADDLRRRLDQSVDGQGVSRQLEDFAEDADKDVRQHYTEIENALTTAIGPVAKMVMSECVYKWKHGGPESVSRLSELLQILVEEIEDPDLVADFKSRLQHLF